MPHRAILPELGNRRVFQMLLEEIKSFRQQKTTLPDRLELEEILKTCLGGGLDGEYAKLTPGPWEKYFWRMPNASAFKQPLIDNMLKCPR